MEDEGSHAILSTSLRTREADDIIKSASEDLVTCECNCQSQKPENLEL